MYAESDGEEHEDEQQRIDDNISGSDDDDSRQATPLPSSVAAGAARKTEVIIRDKPQQPVRHKKVSRLVSYGPDDEDDEKVDGEENEDVKSSGEEDDGDIKKYDVSINADLSSSLSRSVKNMKADDIEIPPEPPGKCSRHLQEKISKFYEKMKHTGQNLNHTIQKRTDFRNPSIYEKLIDYCHINEKGTNYPPELYNPGLYNKYSFYDELAKTQKTEMDKREKEKKDRTKIEFMSGTAPVKKSASTASLSSLVTGERKSKWDSQPVGLIGSQRPAVLPSGLGPQVVSVTASASGTKTTVISAVGTISKKK
ncbi:SAP30-binding protein-like isoform X2 [Tubulanus polymorphus]